MKKLLLAIVAMFAMIACNNEQAVLTKAPSAITFGDSFIEIKTRATAEDPSITTATIQNFDVWGFIETATGTVFDAERVTRGENGWSYENTQWWVPSKNYYFHAVSPVEKIDEGVIVINTTDMDTYGLGNIAFTNNAGDVDLLYTTKHVETRATEPYYDGKVSLQFMHLLSKIKFTFTNGFTNNNSSLAVKNIQISDAPAKGNIDVNKEYRTDFVWDITQDNSTVVLDFGDVNDGKPIAVGASDESARERLTISADANRSYTIEFDLELWYGNEKAMDSHKSVTLTGQAFEIGKNYNITATIKADNFSEEALLPIEFDVITVEEWVEGDFNWNGTQTPEDPDQPVDPEEPADGFKLYFKNVSEWAKVYAHIWANEGEDLGLEASEWPGRKLEATEEGEGVTYYVFQLPAEATGKTVNVVFNDGNGTQTKDLSGVATEDLYFDNYVEPVQPTDTILYLKPNANWKNDNPRYAAYFFGNGETWVDMTLVEGETDIYAVTVPAGFEDIIFCRMSPTAAANNWNNKWNQTVDLKVPTDGTNLYTVKESTWDKGGGTWSVYTPATVEPEPEPEPEEKILTVAEFLVLTDVVPSNATAEEIAAAPMYTLKGTITAVANTTYGNFDLTDETGTVLIYGLNSPDGATNKYWATSGAKLGDDITVKTIRTEYGNSPQGKNAWFVELASPGTYAFYTVDPAAVDFASVGGEQDIEVFAYNTTAGVTATSDNSAFTVDVNGYVVTVTAAANELEEDVTGNITIKVGDLEATVVKATLAAKPAAGQVEGGKDDFDTKSANTSYTTGTTAAGWKYTNCALLNKSTVSAITDNSIGVTMNGKTSAVGSIESPVITTGCGTLKFNYAHGYKESNGFDFNVQIIQNGEIVKTFNVKNTSTTQNKLYQFEENVNLSGEFSIKFTNNSPSKNSSSNKDRYTIWDVEWTGCN